MIIRKENIEQFEQRYSDTLQKIIETKKYNYYYIQSVEYKKTHQTSIRYEKRISEFENVGLEELFYPFCKAPFATDAMVKIAMR
jgi:hypothetical protein